MTAPVLEIDDLSVTFPVPKRGGWPWTKPDLLHAVSNATLSIAPGETLGLVGESGSGKSTLARAIVRTVPASGGTVTWKGQDLSKMPPDKARAHGRHVQMIFQDPLAALNPRMTVGQAVAEPYITHYPDTPKAEVRRRVQEMMEKVGLLPTLLNRYPHEFSGGQCQRIGIARAIALNPGLIICDEPVSALDVSIQSQILNLLIDLQRELNLSYLFIAHDLAVVKHISDRIAIMYLGRIAEIGPGEAVYGTPNHPYTQSLISAIPVPDPHQRANRVVLSGDVPSPIDPPSGCSFHTRCPRATDICREQAPPLALHGAGVAQTTAACHHI